MYTAEGIVVISALNPKNRKVIPWDTSRDVTIRSIVQCTRRTVVLREEHFPIFVLGNGVGGFWKERDVGRKLTVDFFPDGRKIDTLSMEKVAEVPAPAVEASPERTHMNANHARPRTAEGIRFELSREYWQALLFDIFTSEEGPGSPYLARNRDPLHQVLCKISQLPKVGSDAVLLLPDELEALAEEFADRIEASARKHRDMHILRDVGLAASTTLRQWKHRA